MIDPDAPPAAGAATVAERPTFRDPELERQYRDQGFTLMPFLTPEEVAEVTEQYWALAPADESGLAVDYLRPDRTFMRRVRDLLQPLWERHLPPLFTDHHAVFATFVVKHPGAFSDLWLHDDRSWVDERAMRSGTLWIPLVDVGPGNPNGHLEIIRHSHRLAHFWSGTATPDLIRPYEGVLRAELEPLAVPAGSAVYYDSRTLHASPENHSSGPRIAIVCGLAPRDVQLIHVVGTGRRHRLIHAVDEEFFLRFGPEDIYGGIPPEYPVIEEADEDPTLPAEAVAALVGHPVTAADTTVKPPADVVEALGGMEVPCPQAAPVRCATIATTADLAISAADAGPLPERFGGTPLTAEGPCGATTVAAAATWPAMAPGFAAAFEGRRDLGDHLVVVIDPGTRLRLEADEDGAGLELAVVEAPGSGSGVAAQGTTAQFNPGECFEIDPSRLHLAWNEGPGPAVIVLSERLAPRPGPAARLARLLGRRRAAGA